MAANRTVDENFRAHSLHCYFIEQGFSPSSLLHYLILADADRPLVYQVARVRDGRSFATRLVKARQNGKTVCTCSVSYQVK